MDQIADKEILLTLLRDEPVDAQSPESWNKLADLARRHELAPLLLQRTKDMKVPADVRQDLRKQYRGNAFRNLLLYRELTRVLECFHQEAVPVIVLKGAYLAEHVYKDIALRPMRDLDLLVRREDLTRVEKLMTGLAFVRSDQNTEIVEEHRHFRYMNVSNKALIEIHWDLIEATFGIRVELDGLWERSSPTLVAGIHARKLNAEDQVLHLCVHTSNHAFEHGLRAVYDLAATLTHYEGLLDWEALRRRAQEWNADRCLYVNLWLARKLLLAPVPAMMLDALKPEDFANRYLLVAEEHLFGEAKANEGQPQDLNVIRLWAERDWRRRVRLWWRGIFPRRQMMAIMYGGSSNSWRISWYYMLRPLDLIRRHGRLIWGLFLGEKKTRAYAEAEGHSDALRSWLLRGS